MAERLYYLNLIKQGVSRKNGCDRSSDLFLFKNTFMIHKLHDVLFVSMSTYLDLRIIIIYL